MEKSQYRNTISVFYVLFCLFITYASATSFIRQFTDDFNTNMQQEERARPISNVEEEVYYLPKYQEISSRDYKVSASSKVMGARHRRPSTYSLKMESFNTLLKSTNTERYKSRPFTVGGYNWTLVVYPKGNKNDNGAGYLSLYVAIDNSTLAASTQAVYVDLKFYIYNNNDRKYLTIQDTDVWRFTNFRTMWGFSQVLPVNTFKDPKNGFLYDGDHCEFGVDVTIPSHFQISELFTVNENFPNRIFTWKIRGFSTLRKDRYLSDMFSIGGRSWNIIAYPNGYESEQGKAFSMFLSLNENEKFRPYEKIYVRAKLRVLSQGFLFGIFGAPNVEKPIDHLFNGPGYGIRSNWGYYHFISLSDLTNLFNGYLVNDELTVQVEMEAISSTKYFPN